MNKYNGLLKNIAAEHGIAKGQSETETDWKVRIIYSICGMMAYASLWDRSEETVSIVHMKNRIGGILEGYEELYPETKTELSYISTELEDEIFKIFLNTGMVYHCPDRIAPSMYRESVSAGVRLIRGIPIDSIQYISGTGFYATNHAAECVDDAREMFGLETQNLKSLWKSTVSAAGWISKEDTDLPMEYLRTKPPFTKGYWVNQPDTNSRISILRIGMCDSQIYYLYRYQGKELEVSPLPSWRADNYNYRVLSCACLDSICVLPPIEYRLDGDLVHLHLNYLLPPRELAFLKLYSWPERCTTFPCDFKRTCSMAIFQALQDALAKEGYTFKEE